ncbi:hypothetical protein Cylst_1244 [Cylindrospermum stagnale PCC 7417]|uniref:DUF2281 domain-containing protein n=1 Tax=Cylindrospermum stagnale PCC 7417 TaxID=56107 RepID=K9WT37_9NOST|nr:hypothetical protein [Cylindrospermum stagnale]AFZ23540.1 hypothetical protein Cylst_1244 [Cylindrospermum stagnale PCC 7417]
MTSKEQLIREIEQAPDNLIEELLDFLLFAKARRNQQNTASDSVIELTVESREQQLQPKSKPIWEIFSDFTNELPEEVITQLPTDGAVQIDHYIYGKPKQES